MNDEINPPDHKNNEEKVTKVKNLADLQRMKLEKLMKNPDKPVIIPEKPKTKNVPPVPDFVRNVMGSSAGAGSGEFHVYRHLRRKEYARQKFIQEMSKREQLELEYQEKLERNRKLAEEKTAKKRAKRLKKKAKMKNKRRKSNNQQQKVEKSESESEDSENEDNSEESEKKEEDNEKRIIDNLETNEKEITDKSETCPINLTLETTVKNSNINDSTVEQRVDNQNDNKLDEENINNTKLKEISNESEVKEKPPELENESELE